MKKLSSRHIGIDQGSVVLFSDFEDGGKMWTGTGPREYRHSVAFQGVFKRPPSVHVGISMWDLDQKTNARADISTDEVTSEGFVIVFKTWADTRVARVRADWMAIGELPDEDDWELY
jgi:hypothetical protein